MGSIRDDAIGGFNTFLEEQKKVPKKASFTLVLFDTIYNMVHEGKKLEEVEELTEKTYQPGGCTALLDALGKTLNNLKTRAKKNDNIIVAILTDGHENASKEFKRQDIFKMIEDRKNDGWQFMFLAANQDAIKEGASYGIGAKDCFNIGMSNGAQTRQAYSTMSMQLLSRR